MILQKSQCKEKFYRNTEIVNVKIICKIHTIYKLSIVYVYIGSDNLYIDYNISKLSRIDKIVFNQFLCNTSL